MAVWIYLTTLMKQDIHPTYHKDATVSCVCGNTFQIGSTKERIEVCSACHPFYTGKQKIVDTARRVDRFEKRSAQASTLGQARKGKKVKRAEAAVRKQTKATRAEQA